MWVRAVGAALGAILAAEIASAQFTDLARWTSFTTSLRALSVFVTEDAVWLGSTGGAFRFSLGDGTFDRLTTVDGLPSNRILTIAPGEDGAIWFGSGGQGLARLDPETGFDPPIREFGGLNIRAIEAHQGALFIATERGVSLFLPDRQEIKETYRLPDFSGNQMEAFDIVVRDDTLWVATTGGVMRAPLSAPNLQDPTVWKRMLGLSLTRKLAFTDTALFVATDRGVRRLSGGSWRSDGLYSAKVRDLILFNSTLVAATDQGLFRRLGPLDWEPEPAFIEDMEGQPMIAVGAHANSALWVATEIKGLFEVRGRGDARPTRPNEPEVGDFRDLILDERGVLWAATSYRDRTPQGLLRFDGEQWDIYRKVDGLPSNAVVRGIAPPGGPLLFGTWGKGMVVLRDDGTPDKTGDDIAVINQRNSALRGTIGGTGGFVAVSDFALDPMGNLWVANFMYGLAVFGDFLPFPPKRQEDYLFQDFGAPTPNIETIAVDSRGLLWAGTTNEGFWLFDPGETIFTEQEGQDVHADDRVVAFRTISDQRLTSDIVRDIAVGADDAIWVATDNGLNVVKGDYDRATGTFEVESWFVYDHQRGLPSSSVNDVAFEPRGAVWVGTDGGLARIDPTGEISEALTVQNSGLVSNLVVSLLFDEETGRLYVGTIGGLSILETGRGAKSTLAPSIIAYPNPLVLGVPGAKMQFSGAPPGAELRIFDATGVRVRTVAADSGPLAWDGSNGSQFLVASGIYIYVVHDPATGEETWGKLAVVRRQ